MLLIFFIFVFSTSYEPSINSIIIVIITHVLGMIYLFFSECKFMNFLYFYLYDLLFLIFSLRLGSLSSTIYCLDKAVRLFYFLFLFSIFINFLKQKDYTDFEEYDKFNSNTMALQGIIFILFLVFLIFAIEKLSLSLYTFIFVVIFSIFFLSTRKFLFFLK